MIGLKLFLCLLCVFQLCRADLKSKSYEFLDTLLEYRFNGAKSSLAGSLIQKYANVWSEASKQMTDYTVSAKLREDFLSKNINPFNVNAILQYVVGHSGIMEKLAAPDARTPKPLSTKAIAVQLESLLNIVFNSLQVSYDEGSIRPGAVADLIDNTIKHKLEAIVKTIFPTSNEKRTTLEQVLFKWFVKANSENIGLGNWLENLFMKYKQTISKATEDLMPDSDESEVGIWEDEIREKAHLLEEEDFYEEERRRSLILDICGESGLEPKTVASLWLAYIHFAELFSETNISERKLKNIKNMARITQLMKNIGQSIQRKVDVSPTKGPSFHKTRGHELEDSAKKHIVDEADNVMKAFESNAMGEIEKSNKLLSYKFFGTWRKLRHDTTEALRKQFEKSKIPMQDCVSSLHAISTVIASSEKNCFVKKNSEMKGMIDVLPLLAYNISNLPNLVSYLNAVKNTLKLGKHYHGLAMFTTILKDRINFATEIITEAEYMRSFRVFAVCMQNQIVVISEDPTFKKGFSEGAGPSRH